MFYFVKQGMGDGRVTTIKDRRMNILNKLFTSRNEREIRKFQPIVEKINAMEKQMSALSDQELLNKTVEFKERYGKGETLDELLPEAFAAVREVSKRQLKMRHFDVQLMGGIVLHQGKIAEMATGEGKTLVATLPVYLNSLAGKGVHVVTVNDYLAKRDSEWMGPIYRALGLSVGLVQHDITTRQRQEAYRSDVTYVTNNEVGFDYLRDNMVSSIDECVLKESSYAIVDEVDSILIDEARTPLIISGPAEESTDKYYKVNRIVPMLKGRFVTETEEINAKNESVNLGQGYDYLSDEKSGTSTLTEQGVVKCENLLGVKNLYDDIDSEWVHLITQSLRAHNHFKRDVDYVVKEGQVIIVDEFTGRMMPGRRWSDGLHQSIEAKENLRIAEENQTLATITFQNYFNMYEKLAGMTGTAITEADEFWKIYELDVMVVPTNMPMSRINYPDVIYKTKKEKDNAIVSEIIELNKAGRPMLVGTKSIEYSEHISGILSRRGIPHTVLNAKYHEKEAEIISQAGSKGAVTIATNMAGRGTDIILGGNPPDPKQHDEVVSLSGLHIIGTERHDSRRIDNQLRGRAGRQGDPGSSRFYLALDDELMRLFGSERIANVMNSLGLEEGQDIQHPLITRAIESAQKKVEGMNFDIRKQLLEFDNVMNRKREVVYGARQQVLKCENIKEDILSMIEDIIDDKLDIHAPVKVYPERWKLSEISSWLNHVFDISFSVSAEEVPALTRETLGIRIAEKIKEKYEAREKEVGEEGMRYMERMVKLHVLDSRWKDHLYDMDQLRKGINLRAYGQKDPIIEYKQESARSFDMMEQRMKEEISALIFRVKVNPQHTQRPSQSRQYEKPSIGSQGNNEKRPAPVATTHAQASIKSIGRNDPCPCGSGKKYKKCCGK
jgi:preprotein translocase subunit SecA